MSKFSVNKVKVSIIVVYYKDIRKLINTLKSIFRQKTKYIFEVIVVDNSSEGNLERRVRKVNKSILYIKSGKNLGYGAGNNLGARYAKGEYLFILNPDTALLPGAIDILVKFLERNKDVGIAAPNLVDYKARPFPLQGTRELTPIRAIFALSFLNKLFPNNFVSQHYFMKDIAQEAIHEADVVPGTAFLIRKKLFDQIGGFDENFFLYFEESDLCKRVKEAGWKIFIIPQAQVIHFWKLKKGLKHKKIFQKSRFYYFKKHYKTLAALVVEIFTSFSKWHAGLIAILLIAGFLRFYKIDELMPFIGDYGWYYLQARDMLLSGKIPLVGIPSSVPILRQGAVWTWLLALALRLGNFNPVSGAILTGVIGLSSILGIYFLVRQLTNKKVGVICALTVATLPTLVYLDRSPFQTALIFPLTLLVAWLTFQARRENPKYTLALGFCLAILFQVELVCFILLPITLLTLISARYITFRKLILIFTGGFWGLLPFFIYDFQNKVFIQTIGFLVWMLIKFFEFVLSLNILSFLILLILSFLFLGIIFNYLGRFGFLEKFIFIWLVTSVAGFKIRGIISSAYLPVVFSPSILTFALFINFIIKKSRIFGYLVLTIFILGNTFFVLNSFGVKKGIYLRDRLRVVDRIIVEANGEDFDISYIGPGDEFHSADNHYHYLLWLRGYEPKKDSRLVFKIFENHDEGKINIEKEYD